MKKAYIISTGTELLLGSTIDTNSAFLGRKLTDIGIKVIGKSVVGDNREHLEEAFKLGLRSADLVISSGGLGPTRDDLTKEVACKVMGARMEIIEDEVKHLHEFFARRRRDMPESNIKQAMFPPESIILKNPLGTAPGMYLKKDNKVIILLPGPPREMENMYVQEVEPLLKKEFQLENNRAVSRIIKILGPGESQVEERLADVIDNAQGCSLALLAVDGEVHIKVTAEGEDIKDSRQMLEMITEKIKERLGDNIIGYDEETLSSIIAKLLVDKGKTIAVAESCTGGLIAKLITDLPGSSRYFWGSVTSYSNEAKKGLLNVKEETLVRYGAVSKETAVQMAQGLVDKYKVDVGLSTTGIAGPKGGTDKKPVGLVYIALADSNGCRVKEMRFVGRREAIRLLTAKTALDLLRRYLISGGKIDAGFYCHTCS